MPSPVADTLEALADCFASLGIDWYLFGAQAALLRGSRRLTSDVDVTVFLGQVAREALVDRMTAMGFVLRVPRDGGFIERTRVVPFVHASSAVPVDVVLGGAGLEAYFLAECEHLDLEGVVVPTPRAEHLIVMKLLAGRDKDLDDAAAIARAAQPDLAGVETMVNEIATAVGEDDSLRALAGLKRLLERDNLV
jgi:hypothetical protein